MTVPSIHALCVYARVVTGPGGCQGATGGVYIYRFEYNRTPIKRQHQALMAQSASAQRLLFPLPQHVPLDRVIDGNEFRITMFNTRISSNAAQFQAAKSILRMKHGAAPFIIFGP